MSLKTDKQIIDQNRIEGALNVIFKKLNDRDFECVYYVDNIDKYRAVYSHEFTILGQQEVDDETHDSRDWYNDYTDVEVEVLLSSYNNGLKFIDDLDESLHDAINCSYSETWFNYMTKSELLQIKEALMEMPTAYEWAEDSGEWNAWLAFDMVLNRLLRNK